MVWQAILYEPRTNKEERVEEKFDLRNMSKIEWLTLHRMATAMTDSICLAPSKSTEYGNLWWKNFYLVATDLGIETK